MGLKDKEIYNKTPFVKIGVIEEERKKKVYGDTEEFASLDTGDIMEVVKKEYKVFIVLEDKRKYVKLFIEEDDYSYKNIMKLGNAALRFLLWIMANVKPNKNMIYIDSNILLKNCGYKESSTAIYYKGVEELIDNKFIAKSEDANKYWINLNYFTNGKRIGND